jgi:hypothetical protein
MYKILNEEQEQGLPMGNFSIHDIFPIIVNLVEDSNSENSDDDEDE